MTGSCSDSQQTIPAVFFQRAADFAERTAMRKKEFGLWHDISWMAYAEKVRRVGAALMAMGLQKGEAVSIIGDNCPE